MDNTKIEFRCMKGEKDRLYEMAKCKGVSVRSLVLDATIYKRGRSSMDTREKAALQRMKTSLNKISSGIDEEQEKQKIIAEVRELCQSLKR